MAVANPREREISLPEGCVLRYEAPATSTVLRRVWAWTTATLFSSLFVMVPLVSLGLLVWLCMHPLHASAWLAIVGWALLGVLPHREWPAFRKVFCTYVVESWVSIFDFTVIIDGVVPPQTKTGYLLGVHPHGIVPLGSTMYMMYAALYTPGVYGRTAAASIVLRLPVFRQLFVWLGMVDASSKSLRHHIQQSNLAVLPGGIAELLLSSREEEVLYLRKRTGFARIAHTAGVQLVPSYCFGNNQFFSQLSTSSGFVARLSRRLRMSLTVFWGQWLLPIPHQTRVTMVFGPPIDPQETVEKTLEAYIQGVQAVFDKYKEFAGFGDRTLRIK